MTTVIDNTRSNSLSLKSLIIWIVILSCALLIRFYHLGAQSFWIDECYSATVASWALTDMFAAQVKDSSPPLYYGILHFWIMIFGRSELAIRSLSALMGVGTVLVGLLLGRVLGNERIALVAGSISAISPALIYYSQEARMYSMVTCLAGFSIFFFYLTIRSTPQARYLILFWIVTTMALYTQVYAVFVLMAEVFTLLILKKQSALIHLKRLFLIPILLYIPWIIVIIKQLHVNTTPWIRPPSIQTIKDMILYMCVRSWRLPIPDSYETLVWIICGVFLVTFLIGFLHLIRSRSITIVLILWWSCCIFLPLLYSFQKPMFYAGRYEIISYPAFFLLIGFGIDSVERVFNKRYLIILLLSLCIGVYSLMLATYFSNSYIKSTDRDSVKVIDKIVPEAEPILFTDLCSLCYRYYGNPERAFSIFPDDNLGWIPAPALHDSDTFFVQEWNDIAAPFITSLPQPSNIWVAGKFDLQIYRWFLDTLSCSFGAPMSWSLPQGINDVQFERLYKFQAASKE